MYNHKKNNVRSPQQRQLNLMLMCLLQELSPVPKSISLSNSSTSFEIIHFPIFGEEKLQVCNKKLQGKKNDEALVGIIFDSEPKTVEEAAKIVLLCNNDDV